VLTEIPWSGTYMSSLNTDGTNYFFVAISNSRTSGNFELYFEDHYCYFSTNLSAITTYYYPTINVVSSYNFNNYRTYDSKYDSAGTTKYYYSFSYRDKDSSRTLYVVFKYYGSYSTGTLKVKCTNDDPEDYSPTHNDSYSTDKVAKVVGSALSAVAIVFIVIGSLIGLGILITIIVFICICTRKKTTYGSAGFIQPQTVINSNPGEYLLNNPYPNSNPNPKSNLYPNSNPYPSPYSGPSPNPSPSSNPYPNSNPTYPSP